jgi:hypothetical protein
LTETLSLAAFAGITEKGKKKENANDSKRRDKK